VREFTFSLTEGQVQIWERFAGLKGCGLEHLVKVIVPSMTNEFLFCMVHPEASERIEEEVLTTLPSELGEMLLRQRRELNLRLREHQPEAN
jgi:hypothetical protein